jgi:hypothetical protein
MKSCMSLIIEKSKIRGIIALKIEAYFYDFPGIFAIHLISNYFIEI